MIEASKLRAGMTFVTSDGKLIKVLEASHHKPGKGNTVMRMKLRDVRTGSTLTLLIVQKKNLNKQSSKHVLHNTFTKWMTQHTSWILKATNNMKFQLLT